MKNLVQLITTTSTFSFALFYLTQQPFAIIPSSPDLRATYHVRNVGWKDVIFTEIFADPSPSVGLPPSEFIEIFNRTAYDIDLAGWQIGDGTSVSTFSEIVLRPGEYLIVTGSPEDYNGLGHVLGVKNFPSLNNAGDALALRNAQGTLIDSVHYQADWYKDENRKNGGWSLELIDPQNLCSDEENWIVSDDPEGGTPGKQNNMYSEKPDLSGPRLTSVIAVENNTIQLEFDESLSGSLPGPQSFQIEPLVEINTVEFMTSSLKSLTLSLADTLTGGVIYKIAVSDVYDCSGNSIQPDFDSSGFGRVEKPEHGDIVINEVLFNPGPTGSDFVEIRNCSAKYINISNWSLTGYDADVINDASVITEQNYILQPYGYLALTENKELLLSAYPKSNGASLFEVKKLPPMNDDDGALALMNENAEIIDAIRYSANMHSIFIRDREGVSLERTSAGAVPDDVWNWKSASANSDFGTPGYVNSNDLPLPSVDPEGVTVDPDAFIPGTGYPDFTRIHYHFRQGGYVANVRVYDVKGRVVKEITNNEILGTEGALRWDGDTDSGLKARTGYYMIWFEIFNSSGLVRVIRRSVAVAAHF
jgi:hypothetical protein